MIVKTSFMLLCKLLDFASHNIHLQVSVEVIVSNVPGCIDHVPEYFVLELLCDVYVTLVHSHSWIRYVQTGFRIFVHKKFVLKRHRGVPSYQPVHFCILVPVPLFSFRHGLSIQGILLY